MYFSWLKGIIDHDSKLSKIIDIYIQYIFVYCMYIPHGGFWICDGSLIQRTRLLGRGPGFESGIFRNDPNALLDHCEIMQYISAKGGKPTTERKKDLNKLYSEVQNRKLSLNKLNCPGNGVQSSEENAFCNCARFQENLQKMEDHNSCKSKLTTFFAKIVLFSNTEEKVSHWIFLATLLYKVLMFLSCMDPKVYTIPIRKLFQKGQ